jgi:hypothetical protein
MAWFDGVTGSTGSSATPSGMGKTLRPASALADALTQMRLGQANAAPMAAPAYDPTIHGASATPSGANGGNGYNVPQNLPNRGGAPLRNYKQRNRFNATAPKKPFPGFNL